MKLTRIVMTKFTLVALTVIGLVAAPAAAQAATFQYIGVDGCVDRVQADNAMTALLIAPGIALHSGVMMIADDTPTIPSDECVPLTPWV